MEKNLEDLKEELKGIDNLKMYSDDLVSSYQLLIDRASTDLVQQQPEKLILSSLLVD